MRKALVMVTPREVTVLRYSFGALPIRQLVD